MITVRILELSHNPNYGYYAVVRMPDGELANVWLTGPEYLKARVGAELDFEPKETK